MDSLCCNYIHVQRRRIERTRRFSIRGIETFGSIQFILCALALFPEQFLIYVGRKLMSEYNTMEAEYKEATPTAWLSGRVFSFKVSEHKLIMLSKSIQP